jgi:hypothetical protein
MDSELRNEYLNSIIDVNKVCKPFDVTTLHNSKHPAIIRKIQKNLSNYWWSSSVYKWFDTRG